MGQRTGDWGTEDGGGGVQEKRDWKLGGIHGIRD